MTKFRSSSKHQTLSSIINIFFIFLEIVSFIGFSGIVGYLLYISFNLHNKDYLILVSWIICEIFLILFIIFFNKFISKLHIKNSLSKHPDEWLAEYEHNNSLVPTYFFLNDGKEFYVDDSFFDYTSESIIAKELFFILLLPLSSIYFFMLAILRPWANSSLLNLCITLFIPILILGTILLIAFYPIYSNPAFGVFCWRLSRGPNQQITVNIDRKGAQSLSFSFNSNNSYPIRDFTSTKKELRKDSGIRNFFTKNKGITILSINAEFSNTENTLFIDSSALNVKLINTCIKKWLHVEIPGFNSDSL